MLVILVSNSGSVSSQGCAHLRTCQTTDELLSGSGGLVVGASGSVRVILGNSTRGRSRESGKLSSGMGRIVLSLGLVLLGLTLGLDGTLSLVKAY